MKEKVGFNDLSWLLKISVVSSLVITTLYLIIFIIGFIQGVMNL